ncbi:MAG: hypothetical protein ACU0B7_15295 [Paracoccaceae bacterium]
MARFKITPPVSVATEDAATALVQSSSTTTVMTTGSARTGLSGFPQAAGVVYCANGGTKAIGWMVTLLGFTLKLGALVGFSQIWSCYKPERWVRCLTVAIRCGDCIGSGTTRRALLFYNERLP